jgi:lipid-A-disaccharide synthase
MRRAAEETGTNFLFDLASLGITGFIEPLRQVPTLIQLHSKLATLMRLERPDAAVCIDFYGFNRHILSSARSARVPAFYYISPQVWASRPGRIKTIKRLVDRMLVIFPFEEELYREAGVPVTWVGHPLLDLLPGPAHPRAHGGLRVGLLPGSRRSEIARHLSALLGAARLIHREQPEASFPLFAAPGIADKTYLEAMEREAAGSRKPHPASGPSAVLDVRIVRESAYAERSRLDIALTSSGTATVENALLGVPMVVMYRLSWPTYALARALIKVRHIAMANLLAGRELVPELIQHEATPRRIARAALDMLADPVRLSVLRQDLLSLRDVLGGPGATSRTAEIL